LLSFGEIGGTPAHNRQGLAQLVVELGDAQQPDPGRHQLDGKGETINPLHDRSHRIALRAIGVDVNAVFGCSIDEEPHGGGYCAVPRLDTEGEHLMNGLPLDPKWRAARDEQRKSAAPRDEVGDGPAAAYDVIEGVEYEQCRVGDLGDHDVDDRCGSLGVDANRLGDRHRNPLWLCDLDEVGKCGTTRELSGDVAGRLGGQAGLADAAGAEQCKNPRAGIDEATRKIGHLRRPSDEGGGEGCPAPGDGPRRREIVGDVGGDQLIHAPGRISPRKVWTPRSRRSTPADKPSIARALVASDTSTCPPCAAASSLAARLTSGPKKSPSRASAVPLCNPSLTRS